MRREEDLRALMRDLARVDRAIMETGACLKPLYALQIGIRSLPHIISSYFQGLSDPSSSDSGVLEVVLRLMQKVVLDSEYKATVDSNIRKLLTHQPEQCLTCVNVAFGILLLPLLSEEEEADDSGPAATLTLNMRKSGSGGGFGAFGFGGCTTILRAGVEFVGASRFAIGLEDQPDGVCAQGAPAVVGMDSFRYSAGDEARTALSSGLAATPSFAFRANAAKGNAVPAQAEDVRGSNFVRIDFLGHGSSTREQRVVLRGAADKVVVESSHDYEESSHYQGTVEIEGALELKVTFDPKCHTKDNDQLRVGSHILYGCPIGFPRDGFGFGHHSPGNWGDFTHIGSKIDFDFQARGSEPRGFGDRRAACHWGWKFTVTATKFEEGETADRKDSRSTDSRPENARRRLAFSFLSSALNHELCRPLLTAPHRFKVILLKFVNKSPLLMNRSFSRSLLTLVHTTGALQHH